MATLPQAIANGTVTENTNPANSLYGYWTDGNSDFYVTIANLLKNPSAIGAGTPAAGTFTTLASTGNTTLGDAAGDTVTFNSAAWSLANATTVTGTWADLGAVTTVDINGGTLDGVTIGGSSAGAGTFTTLNATGGGSLTGTWSDLGTVTTVDINGGTLDGVTIGATTPAVGTFTDITVSSITSTGELGMGGSNLTDVGDITFQTGVNGGTLRTGTTGADKFILEAYKTGAGAGYLDVLELDAGNPIVATFNPASSADVDIHFNGAGVADLILVDASADNVQFGGTIGVTGTATLGTLNSGNTSVTGTLGVTAPGPGALLTVSRTGIATLEMFASNDGSDYFYLTADSSVSRLEFRETGGFEIIGSTSMEGDFRAYGSAASPSITVESTNVSGVPLFVGKGSGNLSIRYVNTSGVLLSRIDVDSGSITMRPNGTSTVLDATTSGVDITGSLTLTTDLAVTHGGTGASTASGARTNLGLVIGTDVQAYNATLAAVAGGTYTGATSITTLGTIATGTWQGTAIANAYVAGIDQNLLTSSSPTFAGATIADITIGTGTITASGGAISFGNENLSTTGTLRIGTTSATSHGGESLRVLGGSYLINAHRNAAGAAYGLQVTNTNTGSGAADGFLIGIDANGGPLIYGTEAQPMQFLTNNTERFRVASDAYALGIGTTDVESWDSTWSAIEMGAGAVAGVRTTEQIAINSGIYRSGSAWKYKLGSTSVASYQMFSGAHLWYTAAGGTIDTTATLSEKMRLTNGGVLAIGTTAAAGNELLRVNGLIHSDSDSIIVDTAKTPASASATGTQGQIAWDSSYIYVCTAANTWRRVAHSTW